MEQMSVQHRHGNVVRFRPRETMPAEFSWADRAAMAQWSTEAAGRQAVLCTSETGPFALLYLGGMGEPTHWATFALARQGEGILLWDAATFRDIGRYTTVQAALRSLGTCRPTLATRLAEVVRFRPTSKRGSRATA